MHFWHWRLTMASLLLPLLAACGPQGAERATVRGQVTLDGAPLKQGSILFLPMAGNAGVATGGPIVDGKYELTGDSGPNIGLHRIEVRAVRKSGRKEQKPFAPAGEMVETDEEAVAEQFNSASTLQLDVRAGEQSHDLAVASRPTQQPRRP
jgi:hypothetical protein